MTFFESMPLEVFQEINHDELKHEYIERLIEEWDYSREVAENTDDWRDEYVQDQYKVAKQDYERTARSRPIQSHEIEYT